jgi:polyisoprenoid-binding protein YceI
MRNKLVGGMVVFALAAPVLGLAQGALSAALRVQPESKVWVEGTSTVRSFTCEAKQFKAAIETGSGEPVAAVVAGEKAVSSVSVEIPVATLDCGNGQMNDHMRKALNATRAPVIRYQLTSYDLVKGSAGVAVKLHGKLDMGGTEKPIVMEAQATQGPNGTLQVTGAHAILLSEFGLKAPSLMMGTMKVGDRVMVKYDLALKP